MKKLERPIYIPFKVSEEENAQIEYLMEKMRRGRSDLIRYVIKRFYTELQKKLNETS